jgi:hypothetical protein
MDDYVCGDVRVRALYSDSLTEEDLQRAARSAHHIHHAQRRDAADNPGEVLVIATADAGPTAMAKDRDR